MKKLLTRREVVRYSQLPPMGVTVYGRPQGGGVTAPARIGLKVHHPGGGQVEHLTNLWADGDEIAHRMVQSGDQTDRGALADWVDENQEHFQSIPSEYRAYLGQLIRRGHRWPPEPPSQINLSRRRYDAYRAPAGGIVARGTVYQGGEMIPDMEGSFMNPPKSVVPKRPAKPKTPPKFHPERIAKLKRAMKYGRAPHDEVAGITIHQGEHGGYYDPNNHSDMILADKLADHSDPLETVVRRDLSYRGGGRDDAADVLMENLCRHINELSRSGSPIEEDTSIPRGNYHFGLGWLETIPYGNDGSGNALAHEVRWVGPHSAVYYAAMTPEETIHLLNEHGINHNIKLPWQDDTPPDDDDGLDYTPTGNPEEDRQSRIAARQKREKLSRRKAVKKYAGETTEEDFHRMLDANPEDHQTRMVFADWLQDRGDPRAEGYRALGRLGRYPHESASSWAYHNGEGTDNGVAVEPEYSLPQDWLNLLDSSTGAKGDTIYPWPYHNSRREAEDHAAREFSRLPPERQQQIMNEVMGPAQMTRRSVKRYAGETTEEDFHRMLDENPNDHHTRLVFADWLQDRGDPRAEGYRALGSLQHHPFYWKPPAGEEETPYPTSWYWGHAGNEYYNRTPGYQHGLLNHDWMHNTPGTIRTEGPDDYYWRYFSSRREAEDAAALSFSKLTPEQQQEITSRAANTPQKMTRRRVVRRYSESERASFLHQLAHDENDHTTRKVFADWLEENEPGVSSEVLDRLRNFNGRMWVGLSPKGKVNAIPRLSKEILEAKAKESPWGTPSGEFYHSTSRNNSGRAHRVRVSGKMKTWKTRPDEFRVPWKYGLYDNGEFTHRNVHEWLTDDPTAEPA